MKNIVIVESPAKAKTINKYLGDDFQVLASYGHVRDLPSKSGSVRPDDNFSMDWEIHSQSEKHIKKISNAIQGATHLFLATDPDREGEAISWHVQDLLEKNKSLGNIKVKRVVFNEITKNTILEAFKNPRDVDNQLVHAYFARRALDYLVGFTLSPILWRKLPGSKSAGRVQSVALRLICDRETDIENFISQEYWSIKADFLTENKNLFSANLTHLKNKKLSKLSIITEVEAKSAVSIIQNRLFTISNIEEKKSHRHPSPPFTTSTLQQEASRKLRFGAKRTMQIAQKLYEGINVDEETVGLISYIRTDGVQMANEAIGQVRNLIDKDFGPSYIPKKSRLYKSKAKNAQEAHEAIRPTDIFRRPKDLELYLDNDQQRLYKLIWERTVASQMESVTLEQVIVNIDCKDQMASLRANGSVIKFEGFLRVYKEDQDDISMTDDVENHENKDRLLPPLRKSETLETEKVSPEQHFTQPKPRFTEASLVKTLEENGIGRPSTYASIISKIQESYVKLEQRRFIPESRGRIVTAFLESYFPQYVRYDFTADMENKLDDISGGRIEWKKVLREFWDSFDDAVNQTKEIGIRDVLDKLDEILGPHFFRPGGDGIDPRVCQVCKEGRLNIKIGKSGAFVGCSNYPECRFTRSLEVSSGSDNGDLVANSPKILGNDPTTDKPISLRKGPFGYYVQLGEETIEKTAPPATNKSKPSKKAKLKKVKPQRTSVPRTMDPSNINLEIALGLLSLPREVGIDPETHDMIIAAIGRFGPYIKRGGTFVSLKGDDDVLSIGLNRAAILMSAAPKKDPPKEIGTHPKDEKIISMKKGRWGYYLQHGRIIATIPKGTDASLITLEQAITLINQKTGKPLKKTAKKKSLINKV